MTLDAQPLKKLTAVVIGGSISGLMTGLRLSQAGADVCVYERTRLETQRGGAMTLESNALGLLDRMNVRIYDGLRVRAVDQRFDAGDVSKRYAAMRRYMTERGEIGGFHTVRRKDTPMRRFPFRRVSYSWQSVVNGLLKEFPAASYFPGHTLTDLVPATDSSSARATFQRQSGETVTRSADLIVVADGLNSTGSKLLGRPAPTYAGYVAWRGQVPFTAIKGTALARRPLAGLRLTK